MKYLLSKSNPKLEGEITIPASKSISNRVLIINALSYSGAPVQNLSDCEDTRRMQSVMYSNTNVFDVGDAGTTMRFLTAYLAKVVGEWTLTGSERMKERPIGVLVDALNELGAQITYQEKEGYPPLKIFGSNLTGSVVTLDGGTSSQYISALLLIAPTLEKGLNIKLKGKIVSRPYIQMTLKMMEEFGVKSVFKGNEIRVEHQNYSVTPYTVEGDWSGVSYWYAMMALAEGGKLKLNGLRKNSIQGDAGLIPLFEKLGVKTVFSKRGMHIEKCDESVTKFVQNFSDMPDLAQTFAVCCAIKGIPFRFTGLETLKIKETDRIQALINELGKLGYVLTEPEDGALAWDGTRKEAEENAVISTYRDHRMAMAFAPVAILLPGIAIDQPDVVGKSYPNFWEQLRQVDFQIEEVRE
ncbi:MAG: 3-phosphoshikimate 1-carboxyvinyltransferase [Marinifilaceae bacterium]